MTCTTFIARIADIDRHAFTLVCEHCGAELPLGALNLIDSSAVGIIMVEHASIARMRSEHH